MQELEIRDFSGEEVYRYEQLVSTAFHYTYPEVLDREALCRRIAREDEERAREKTPLRGNTFVRKGAFLDGRLVSAFKMYPFVANLDGERCEMCGIGGVLSDPEMRGMGAVSRLFETAFSEMRERGQILSHLYPFRTSFYRKYGYEHIVNAVQWTVPIEFLPKDRVDGILHFEGTERQTEDIKNVYKAFCRRYNLATDRDGFLWKTRYFKIWAPYGTDHFSYLHYDGDTVDAFLSYTVKEDAREPMLITVDHLYFTSRHALYAVLCFLGTYSSYAKGVKLTLPSNVDIGMLLCDLQSAYGKVAVTRELLYRGATRVVDAEAILRLVRYRGAGSARIRITDPYCPWNDKCFRVEFNGSCRSFSEVALETADIETDINSFSALILGGVSLSDGVMMKNVKIHSHADTLEKIFYKKPLWIEDTF